MKFLVIFFICFSVGAIDLKGFVKSIPQYSSDYRSWDNSARFRAIQEFGDGNSVEIAYGMNLKYLRGSVNFAQSLLTQDRYRILDLSEEIVEDSTGKDLRIIHNLDRININLSGESIDLSVGRQAISFGSARITNTIDFLVPFSISSLDVENRYGVDAVRVRYSLGEMGEIDCGYVFGEDLKTEESSAFISLRYPIFGKMDAMVIFSNFKENKLYGVDIQADIYGAGVWLEGAYRDMKDGDQAANISIGLEYRLSEEFIIFGEYYYNGFGTSDYNDYLLQLAREAYITGGVYNLSENYFGLGSSFQPFPLLNLSLVWLNNMNDLSSLIKLSADYSLADDFSAEIGFLAGAGAPGREYRLFKNMFYGAIKYYF